jgi:hypothetical protein
MNYSDSHEPNLYLKYWFGADANSSFRLTWRIRYGGWRRTRTTWTSPLASGSRALAALRNASSIPVTLTGSYLAHSTGRVGVILDMVQ